MAFFPISENIVFVIYDMLSAEFGGREIDKSYEKVSVIITEGIEFCNISENIFECASKYFSGFINQKPFADNNLAVALFTVELFLRQNNYKLIADEVSVICQTLAMAGNQLTQSEVAQYFADNSIEEPCYYFSR